MAVTLSIDQGIGAVSGVPSGTQVVSPAVTTTYTLTATSTAGQVKTRSTTVTVNPAAHWYVGKPPGTTDYYIANETELRELLAITNGTFVYNSAAIPQDQFSGKKVHLTADIVMSSTPYLDVSASANGIQMPNGEFDGGQHTITGLTIMRDYGSLFSLILHIHDVGIINASNSSEWGTGVLVDTLSDGGSVRRCFVTGAIITPHSDFGGIVYSVSDNGLIEDCYVDMTLQGNSATGIVFGFFSRPSNCINRCWARASLSRSAIGAGVIGGITNGSGAYEVPNSGGTVSNCLSILKNISNYDPARTGPIVASINPVLSNNAASDNWIGIGNSRVDTYLSPAQIAADGTIGGRFTSANGWTTQNGRLPGLFGQLGPAV